MRWLLFARDGWGLGHVSRLLGLARELRQLRPQDEHLFITYSEATHLIAREGFPSVKLPAQQWFKPDEQRNISENSRFWLMNAIIQATAMSYRPQAIVIDTFPVGLLGETLPLLKLPALRFLVAREINYVPPVPEHRTAYAQFHRILAPYREDEIDLALPGGLQPDFVGPILVRSKKDALPRQEARLRLQLPDQGKICLVTFGGGGNPEYANLEAWAVELAARFPDWTFALASPPLLQAINFYPQYDNVKRITYFPLAECYAAFDAAISATGSSSYELSYFGVPRILVPDRSENAAEDHKAKALRLIGGRADFVVEPKDSEALFRAFSAFDDETQMKAIAKDMASDDFPNGAENGARILTQVVTQMEKRARN